MDQMEELAISLDECLVVLRKEAEDGNLYSGLQADVIEAINTKIKAILNDQEV